ncbi:MAG: hypothetical protein KBS62_03140 [Oscillospiraceae bacterium]|nr:hypothetical protein [Candidatus Ruminococcus equi]
MQTTSALYDELYNSNTSRIETKVIVDGVEYGENKIQSIKTTTPLMPEETFSLGGAISAQISLTIQPQGTISRNALIEPYVRVIDDEQYSEWLPKGKYYIDTREYDPTTEILKIEGYDALLKTEQEMVFLEFPTTMENMTRLIADEIGVEVDSRSRFENYIIPAMPTGNLRDILCKIASAHGGNFIMTDEGKLRLVRISDTPDSTEVGYKLKKYTHDEPYNTITSVTVISDNETSITSALEEDNGRSIELNVIYGTQEMADNLLDELKDYEYKPFTGTGAIINPAVELGDMVEICGDDLQIISLDNTFGGMFMADISAPSNNEIDHEYPSSATQKQQADTEQKIKDSHSLFYGTNYEQVNITQIERRLGSINFLVGQDSTAFATFTSEITATQSGKITYYLKLDEMTVHTYEVDTPIGQSLHNFSFPFVNYQEGTYNVNVTVKGDENFVGTIDINNSQLILIGFNLVKTADWNGLIFCYDDFETVDTSGNLELIGITDDVEITKPQANNKQATDNVSLLNVGGSLELVGISEQLNVDVE